MLKADLVVVMTTNRPTKYMMQKIADLKDAGYRKIVLIDDGLPPNFDAFYETAKDEYGCDVIYHAASLGKGRSLKDAFNYILNNYPYCSGVITVGGGTEHSIDVIEECVINLQRHPDDMILGCRDYESRVFPAAERINNKIKKKLIKILTGINVSDTSAGLRAIPIKLVKPLLTVEGEGLDFELNTLLYSQEKGISIREFLINPTKAKKSEFNPLKHSIKIYLVFASYCMTSVVATVLDFLIFSTAVASTKVAFPTFYITISTIIARICSSTLNFYLSKNTVFKKNGNNGKMMLRFFSVVALQMALSALLVSLVYKILPITETVVKIIVDAVLFMVFYQLQREWVFNDKENTGDSGHTRQSVHKKLRMLSKSR